MHVLFMQTKQTENKCLNVTTVSKLHHQCCPTSLSLQGRTHKNSMPNPLSVEDGWDKIKECICIRIFQLKFMRGAICCINIEFHFPHQNTQHRNSRTLYVEILHSATVPILPSFSGPWDRQNTAVESGNWRVLPKGHNAVLWITVHQVGK